MFAYKTYLFIAKVEEKTNRKESLSAVFGESSKTPHVNLADEDDVDDDDEDEKKIEFLNAPYVTWICPDHEKKCTFVYAAIPVFAGSRNIYFTLSADGMKVSLHYTWPFAMTRAEELFHDQLNSDDEKTKIQLNHPTLFTFTSSLLKTGISEKSNMKGTIIVKLPVEVQRDETTWKKTPVQRPDGTQIVLLQFQGFQESTHVKHADTSISFKPLA